MHYGRLEKPPSLSHETIPLILICPGSHKLTWPNLFSFRLVMGAKDLDKLSAGVVYEMLNVRKENNV
jgi:hypothetical protein